ncbi:MAG: phosphate signaling complex PhoU family protein [Arcobacter sp.]|uniref:phosphate signaling complex PhoU family protein n=1 Tax=Arcobacter sp. TaxID=1872629 RepID=UPI003B009063
MLKVYDTKRELIQNELLEIGEVVVESLNAALKALKDDDIKALKDADLSLKKLTSKSNNIDNSIVTALALYQPEAKDLRELVSYLKITNELVRAGGNTKDFIKIFRTSYTDDLNTKTILEFAVPLLKSTILSLQTSMSVIKETSSKHVEEKFQRVVVEESKTDDLYAMIEKNILKLISKNLDLSKEYFNILTSLRKLEKISDRSVAIAHLLLFADKGGELERK